jgi:hypothetical protein
MVTKSQPKKESTNTPKPKEPSIKDKLKAKIKARVDRLDSVTDVLTGKEIPNGKVGEKIKALKELDKSPDGEAKTRRDKKFKKFDEWLVRQQKLNNVRDEAGDEVPYVQIKRTVRIEVDKKGKRKIV